MDVLVVDKSYDIVEVIEKIEKIAKTKKTSVVLIDSIDMIAALGRYYDKSIGNFGPKIKSGMPSGEKLDRATLTAWMRRIEDIPGITPIFIAEADLSGHNLSKTGIPEYECDGVIILQTDSIGDKQQRSITVRKLSRLKPTAEHIALR